MVLRLGATMGVPLRQQNAMLLAAGYAPAWQERDLSMPDLAAVNSALDYMLAHHEPYPAFVIDRRWNLLRANRGAANLTEFLTGPARADTPSEPVNLAVALVSPDGLRPYIVNWQDVVLYFLRGVQADAQADGAAATTSLLDRLLCARGPGFVGDVGSGGGSSAGIANPLPPGRDIPTAVHNDRYTRHTARCNPGRDPHRILLSDG
jgi:MmyB-like transcription regulator ligand binding domain